MVQGPLTGGDAGEGDGMSARSTACPNADKHTPDPVSVVAWQSWAAAMYAQGSRQSRCPGCLTYAIWGGRKPPIDPAEHEGTCLSAGHGATRGRVG